MKSHISYSDLANVFLESGFAFKGWQKEFKKLKGIHQGKACILIGNGPSVTLNDLDKINATNCIKFVFNRFHKIYSSLDFAPDYTMSIDPLFIEDFFDELLEEHKGQLLLGHHKELSEAEKFKWFKIKTLDVFKFSDCPIKFVSPGGSVVVAALQIAYYMGCRDFYLYGVDHKFSCNKMFDNKNESHLVNGDGNHFIKNYRSGRAWHPPDNNLIEDAFMQSKLFIESNDGSLINISRDSQLTVIERADCDEILEKLSDQ